MRLVIDIPEELYVYIQGEQYDKRLDKRFDYMIRRFVRTGIPLPKGHGRLIDADELYDSLVFPTEQFGKAFKEVLDDAPTIIEADQEYEVEVVTRGKCMICGKELTEGLFFCGECEDKRRTGNEISD